MHSIERQIAALEMISDRQVAAITLNHEDLDPTEIPKICERISTETGLPVFDVLRDGAEDLAAVVVAHIACAEDSRE
jgi:uncharacterized NAD-dependent epimerase/dehydratase family protein